MLRVLCRQRTRPPLGAVSRSTLDRRQPSFSAIFRFDNPLALKAGKGHRSARGGLRSPPPIANFRIDGVERRRYPPCFRYPAGSNLKFTLHRGGALHGSESIIAVSQDLSLESQAVGA